MLSWNLRRSLRHGVIEIQTRCFAWTLADSHLTTMRTGFGQVFAAVLLSDYVYVVIALLPLLRPLIGSEVEVKASTWD